MLAARESIEAGVSSGVAEEVEDDELEVPVPVGEAAGIGVAVCELSVIVDEHLMMANVSLYIPQAELTKQEILKPLITSQQANFLDYDRLTKGR